jgi:hypothetical protein
MGNFIDIGIVKSLTSDLTEEYLGEWEPGSGDSFDHDDWEFEDQNGDTVMAANYMHDESAAFFELVSKKTDGVTMHLYIYDSDCWGYHLFDKGCGIDKFRTVPDMFGEGDGEDYLGNSALVAECFGVKEDDIKNYFVPWTEEMLEKEESTWAYEGDSFAYGVDWQVTDFMKKLGYECIQV